MQNVRIFRFSHTGCLSLAANSDRLLGAQLQYNAVRFILGIVRLLLSAALPATDWSNMIVQNANYKAFPLR